MDLAPAAPLELPVRYDGLRHHALNPYWLRGKGRAAVYDGFVGLEGRASWIFALGRKKTVVIPFEEIADVEVAGNVLTFKVETPASRGRSRARIRVVRLLFENASRAYEFARALPGRLSDDVRRQRTDLAEFNERFAHRAPTAIVVPALIALNVLAYAWVAEQGAGWIKSDSRVLIQWGSLFGPLATSGQWWRLLTAAFLHGGIIHIVFNMYALYDSGRLCEQLFGRMRFIAIYALCAIAGSVASVWWNPYVNSVGASGAVFGVYGALLVFMLDKRNGVPFTVMQSHRITIAVFIVYSVINGMAKTGIDNAAHAGGLVAGCVLGWALARPIGDARPSRPLQAIAGVLAVCLVATALFSRTPNTGAGLDAIARFRTDMQWLDGRERQLVAATQAALARLQSGKASPQTAREVSEIAQGWSQAHEKFSGYRLDPRLTRQEYVAMHGDIVAYLDLRRRATLALATALKSSPPSTDAYREFNRLWKESQAVLERIDKRAKAVSK